MIYLYKEFQYSATNKKGELSYNLAKIVILKNKTEVYL